MTTLRPLIAAILVLAAFPSLALASRTQESMFQDDPMLLGSADQMTATLDQLQSIGVDRIRVSVFWRVVAPANDQVQKPTFDAADPAQYPAEHWERYDRLIQEALARGILVNLNITSPIPRWAAAGEAPRKEIQETFGSNAEEFGQFVRAVGTRYSGTYAGLPRVDYWSIWNEPNQAGWLTPQWGPDPRNTKKFVDASPASYRALARNAWQALADTGHGTDTILVGETAPQGEQNDRGLTQSIDALKFIRRLYCLDDNLNILRGSEAQVRDCPGDSATFVNQNPALFHATGYAHHPYALLTPPGRRSEQADWVSMSDLPKLSRELARIYLRYGQKMQSKRGVPLYLTEYGYQTKPDPFSVSFERQAAWINQAEYIAYRNPNVRSVSQFLLVDDAPAEGETAPRLKWRTFQSGLQSLAGKRKPAYKAYVTPIHLTKTRLQRGRSTKVFGMLRAAAPTARVPVQLQFRVRGAKRWQTRKRLTVPGPSHYFQTSLRVTRSGHVRIFWANASRPFASRPVTVTVPGR